MRRIIEHVLISADGGMNVQAVPSPAGGAPANFLSFRDHTYMRDGLGALHACGAMLIGPTMDDFNAKIWPGRGAGTTATIAKIFDTHVTQAGPSLMSSRNASTGAPASSRASWRTA